MNLYLNLKKKTDPYRWIDFATCLVLSLFSAYLSALSILHTPWGYDEFGAVVTHLELDDPKFIEEYMAVAHYACPNCSVLHWVFQNLLLPVFVVPIRWTYALGISAYLDIARFLPLDWPLLKPILVMPNILLTVLGLFLTIRAAGARGVGAGAQLMFLSGVIASAPLAWWITSLSSYSHHLVCFGLLCYANLVSTSRGSSLLWGRESLMRSAAVILNYQYISIAFALCIADLIESRRIFFTERRWRSWIIPALVCLINIIFLYLRARLSGKHTSPATAALTEEQIKIFSFPDQAKSLSSALQMLVDRYIDIFISFYHPGLGQLTTTSIEVSLEVSALVVLVIWTCWRRLDRLLFLTLFSMLLGTISLNLLGVTPLSPSRHQLVLLPPLLLLVSSIIERVLPKIFAMRVLPFVAIVFSLIAIASQAARIMASERGMSVDLVRSLLVMNSVERLVLAPCDLEPMLYPDLRSSYSPIYRCGPRIINKIPPGVKVVAVWSSSPMMDINAAAIVSDFSDETWHFHRLSNDRSNSLYIGHRAFSVH